MQEINESTNLYNNVTDSSGAKAPIDIQVKTKKIYRKKKDSIAVIDSMIVDSTSTIIDSMVVEEITELQKVQKKQKVKKATQKSLNNDLCFHMKRLNLEEHSSVELKMKERKMISNMFPIEGPDLICLEIDRLISLYYIKNHKYIGLRTIGDETHPVFFILLSSEWDENSQIPCQFVKHITWEDDKGDYHVKPEWTELWKIGMLDKKFIYNCIPFDEDRDYYYSNNK